ncbi:sulfotransferase [Ornithinimicrobium faecis]|uniref:Sulfotransferase n=1 Tax=Ornithinimicrobium faecis TaxID=2934158 RepID=A0ABY4YSM6_9MICO|nr:sulfotransferase [Ornithinimicrobium sp. HY1793]USQ79781.1 sulfotransferase [Ornithinimicrobium sp. HY1793]
MRVLNRPLDFAIVGAAKAGTSSLADLVDAHPRAKVLRPKDGHFFTAVDGHPRWQGPHDESFNTLISRAIRDFPLQTRETPPDILVGDASVFYMADEQALHHLQGNLTDVAPVICVLRRPERRAFSAYMHLVREQLETLSFADALAAEDGRRADRWHPLWWYKELGFYAPQIELLHQIFGAARVVTLRYEDIKDRPNAVATLVFDRLGLSVPPDLVLGHTNASGAPRSRWLQAGLVSTNPVKQTLGRIVPKRPWLAIRASLQAANLRRVEMPSAAQLSLMEDYREDIARVQAMTGLDLTDWQ